MRLLWISPILFRQSLDPCFLFHISFPRPFWFCIEKVRDKSARQIYPKAANPQKVRGQQLQIPPVLRSRLMPTLLTPVAEFPLLRQEFLD